MAIGDKISGFKDVGTSLQDLLNYYREQGTSDIIRGQRAMRTRTSAALPQDIGKFSTEYGLGASQQMTGLALEEQNIYNTAAENQANVWGGKSAITGATLQGQNPYQAQQAGIQRDWQRKLKEDEWNAIQQMEKQKSGANLWGSIAGGVGSIFGSIIFNPLNSLKDLIGGKSFKSRVQNALNPYENPENKVMVGG